VNAIFLLLTTAVCAGGEPAVALPAQQPIAAPAAAPHGGNYGGNYGGSCGGSCGAVSDTCCDTSCDCAPSCKHKHARRQKHHKCNDCAPVCCDTCAPAAAPTCGSVSSCGCDTCCETTCCQPKKHGGFFSRFRKHKDCCAPTCDTCDSCDSCGSGGGAVGGCPNCAPAGGAPAGGAPVGQPLPSVIPGAPGPINPGVQQTPEQIKQNPKEDNKGGKGAMLQGTPILTPTTAKVETQLKNPF